MPGEKVYSIVFELHSLNGRPSAAMRRLSNSRFTSHSSRWASRKSCDGGPRPARTYSGELRQGRCLLWAQQTMNCMSVSLKGPQQTDRRGHDSPERGGQASDWSTVRPRGWKTCKRMPAVESGNGVSNSSTPILSLQMYAGITSGTCVVD